ncbi:hypothetical protein [Streptomyces tubercidicus]
MFSRFRRRKSGASTEESAAGAVTAEAKEPTAQAAPARAVDAGNADEAVTEAEGPAAAAPEAADAAAPEAPGDATAEATDAVEPRAEQAGESAGIPRQQSAEAAADSESARHRTR